jgi:hypothetical protein
MRNWSEYTLVSFGDSFTFGQDIVESPQFTDHTTQIVNSEDAHALWKTECNKKSYTQVLCDKMGFKDNLNFGVPGGCNERALLLVDSFLRQNPDKKIFVLFNFTSSTRFLNMFKLTDIPAYELGTIIPTDTDKPLFMSRYAGLTKESLEHYYTYFRNSMQEMYCHIKDRRMLSNLVSLYNVPYTSFDGINDMDYRIIRDNPLQYIHNDDGFLIDTLYNNDENYVLEEMEYFNSYRKELIDTSQSVSHIGMDHITISSKVPPNLFSFLGELGMQEHGRNEFYMTRYGNPDWTLRHWSPDGHTKVAKVIAKYINKNYN